MQVLGILLLVSFLFFLVVRLVQIARPGERRSPINPADDLQAADRVLNRLRIQGIIGPDDEQKWRTQLGALRERDAQAQREAEVQKQQVLTDLFGEKPQPLPPGVAETIEPPVVAEVVEPPLASEVEYEQQIVDQQKVDELPTTSTPGLAPVAKDDFGKVLEAELVPESTQGASPQPALSASQVITSFLAAHNIRWGELVAGMLIVICSIGLVVSLWHTLIETHPVVPSLIFLSANTAIFGAGLYTLSRWPSRFPQ